MATLQKIRTKAGLLVAIVIGLSLAAFILGDMLQSGSSIFRKKQMEVGVIDGESIQYTDFQKKVEKLGEMYKKNSQATQIDDDTWAQIREQAWQDEINKIVMGQVYEEEGIDVSSDELFDLLQGSNIHPLIRRIFTNKETGQFDRGAVVRFLKAMEAGQVKAEDREYWLNLEKQIVENRIQSKYSYMVGKGLYVTQEEAENSMKAGSKSVNFDYVVLPQSSVSDDDISVSERDLKKYYNEHKADYKTEKNRRFEYITYPVNPSEADFADAEKWINDIKPDFETTDEDVQFVDANSDVKFKNVWYKRDGLPENISKWAFDRKTKKGDIFGPYLDDKSYTLARLYKSEMMPDSVKARHILLAVKKRDDLKKTESLADSLKMLIEKGASFAKLAEKYSIDKGSAVEGGDLGWFKRGQMINAFEETAFNQKKGEVSVVTTQFGVHIIQTTKRGRLTPQVQVAFLVREVTPSSNTYQDVYAKASKFAGDNTTREAFDAAVATQKLTKRVANVGENDRKIAGLENARTLIKAAYEAEENNLLKTTQGASIFELGDNFVIAVLTRITEEGIAPFDQVRDRVELAVTKNAKTDFLVKKMKKSMTEKTDLLVLANELGTEVKSATDINFNSYSIPGEGLEPAVIGAVTSLDVDKVDGPIAGNNGVFAVQVTAKNDVPSTMSVKSEQMRLAQTLGYRAASSVIKTHRNAVDIEDNRAKFY